VSSIQHDQKQADKAVNTLLRIARMALVYRWRMLLALLSAIAAACFQLMIPQILGRAVDNAYGLVAGALVPPDEVRQALWAAAGLLLVVGTLRGLFTMLHNYQGEAIGQSIGYELRLAYYEKLQRLSFSYHDRVHTGDLMTRGMLDVEGVRTFVDQAMIRLTLLAILIVVGSFLMLRTDPVLAFLSLSFVPFVAWRAVSARLRLRVIWRRLQEHLGVLTLGC
jgi:ATP-binding cassette subfamily B protein